MIDGSRTEALRRFGVLAASCLGLSVVAAHAQQPAPAVPSVSAPPTISAPTTADKKAQEAGKSNESVAEKQDGPNNSRFSLHRADGGFLRFDSQTGDITFCSSKAEGWGCQAVPQERAALEQEVEKLRAELADLKKKLQAVNEPPRPPKPIPPALPPQAAPPPKSSGDTTFSIPGRDHLARAAEIMQNAWEHFVDLLIGFKNDVLRKSG